MESHKSSSRTIRFGDQIRDQQPYQHATSSSKSILLSPLLSKVFVAILRDALQQLVILGKITKMPPTDVNLTYIPLSQRFEQYEYDNQMRNDATEINSVKFQRDRTYLEKVLRLTIERLDSDNTFATLSKITLDYELGKTEEDLLLQTNKEHEGEMNTLRGVLVEERDYFYKQIHDITESIGNLKDELIDIKVENEAKLKFIESWENSRNEQNNAIIQRQQDLLMTNIKKYNLKKDQEQRTADEIRFYFNETLHDAKYAVQMWMDKYDNEIEDRENAINILKVKTERQHEERLSLLYLYETRQEAIDEYLRYKEQKMEEEREFDRRTRAATRIQAWWRGMMFRVGLGQFRRKKGKGKKGSGENEAKKKKK